MKIDIVFPVLPPVVDGIGDHTAHLSRALAEHADVRVLTAQEEYVPIPGVRVEQGFTMDKRSGVLRLMSAVRARKPDWVFLQFNQFSYGRWGLNPYLAHAMRRIKDQSPGTRVAWMVHEDFMPATSIKKAIMSTWQRTQFRQLGNAADVIFFSIEPWVEKYASWFPDARKHVLPVGSNIPPAGILREVAKRRLGLRDDVLAMAYFGAIRNDRRFDAVVALVHAARNEGLETQLIYVGPDRAKAIQRVPRAVLLDLGLLGAQEASDALVAGDIFLAPYIDGVSGRRGGFLAGLQLGIACVSNVGPLTDSYLKDYNRVAFCLATDSSDNAFLAAGQALMKDPDLRRRVAAEGKKFFEERYSWDAIATTVFQCLT